MQSLHTLCLTPAFWMHAGHSSRHPETGKDSLYSPVHSSRELGYMLGQVWVCSTNCVGQHSRAQLCCQQCCSLEQGFWESCLVIMRMLVSVMSVAKKQDDCVLIAVLRWFSNPQCSKYCSISQSWPTSYCSCLPQQTQSANEVHCLILLCICNFFGCQASLMPASVRHKWLTTDSCIKAFLSSITHVVIWCQLEAHGYQWDSCHRQLCWFFIMAHRCKKRMCLSSCSHSCFLCTTVWYGFADSQGTVQACPQSLKGASKPKGSLKAMHADSQCPIQQVPSQTDTKSNSDPTQAWSLHMDAADTSQTCIRTFAQDHYQWLPIFPKHCLKQQSPDCIVVALISLCLMQASFICTCVYNLNLYIIFWT